MILYLLKELMNLMMIKPKQWEIYLIEMKKLIMIILQQILLIINSNNPLMLTLLNSMKRSFFKRSLKHIN